MRLVLSWLREFVDVDATAERIAETVGLRGFEVAGLEDLGGGDAVIDFEVTANRPDCLSVIGLAREVATAFDRPMRTPSMEKDATIRLAEIAAGASDRLRVTIEDEEGCPRYAALVANVSPQAKSPDWMTGRLQAAGVRPISPIVDVTNYVLLELGQPTHAFDLQKLGGAEILVRRARPGEVLRTLDGVDEVHRDVLERAPGRRAEVVTAECLVRSGERPQDPRVEDARLRRIGQHRTILIDETDVSTVSLVDCALHPEWENPFDQLFLQFSAERRQRRRRRKCGLSRHGIPRWDF